MNEIIDVLKDVAKSTCYKCKQGHEPIVYGSHEKRWLHLRTHECATGGLPGDYCPALTIWDKIKDLGYNVKKWNPYTGEADG